MLRLVLALFLFPLAATADPVDTAVDDHILPGYAILAERAEVLRTASEAACARGDAALETAWAEAFDAWIRVSHLRFGPSEVDNRAFALAFWPDPRNSGPRTMAQLIADEDPAVDDPAAFASISVAARGFYALEHLLFDAQFAEPDTAAYRCRLVQAIARDIALTSAAILADWRADYARQMRAAGGDSIYQSREEAAQELFTALMIGLQFTSDTRLGRPLGTFDRPRPNRAEVRRSGRSLHHVVLSLEATRALAQILSVNQPEVVDAFESAYARALKRAEGLDDPDFSGVADPQRRFRVEVLQQEIDLIREVAAMQLGPALGVAAGFNSLDGD